MFIRPNYLNIKNIKSKKQTIQRQYTVPKCLQRSRVLSYTVPDNNEAVFFLYYIGRYNNEPIYKYGVTTEPLELEFRLFSVGISKFMKLKYKLVEHHVYAFEKFHSEINNLKLNRNLEGYGLTDDNLFALVDNYNFHYISNILDEAFL
jgi:hypothetical protein